MPLDSQNVSEKIPEGSLGSLGGCLVEGNRDQRRREGRLRRRALLLSILIQTAGLAALILLPLFGKTEHLPLVVPTPIPHTRPTRAHRTILASRIPTAKHALPVTF